MVRMLFRYSYPMILLPRVSCGATTYYTESCLFRAQSMHEPQGDNTHYPPQHSLEDSIHHPSQVIYSTLDNPVRVHQPWYSQAANDQNGPAIISTIQSAINLPTTSYTCVKYVVPNTRGIASLVPRPQIGFGDMLQNSVVPT